MPDNPKKVARRNAKFEKNIEKDFSIGGEFSSQDGGPGKKKKLSNRSRVFEKSPKYMADLNAVYQNTMQYLENGGEIPDITNKNFFAPELDQSYIDGVTQAVQNFQVNRYNQRKPIERMEPLPEHDFMMNNMPPTTLQNQNTYTGQMKNPVITDDMSFPVAFDAARKAGMTEFTYKGKVFGTQMAGSSNIQQPPVAQPNQELGKRPADLPYYSAPMRKGVPTGSQTNTGGGGGWGEEEGTGFSDALMKTLKKREKLYQK